MKIYRLQDSDGFGPYNSLKTVEDLYHHFGSRKWPSVNSDVKHFEGGVDLTGCTSIYKLYKWFGKDLVAQFKSEGFRVVCYEIDKAYVKFGKSGKQVAFDPELADEEYEV